MFGGRRHIGSLPMGHAKARLLAPILRQRGFYARVIPTAKGHRVYFAKRRGMTDEQFFSSIKGSTTINPGPWKSGESPPPAKLSKVRIEDLGIFEPDDQEEFGFASEERSSVLQTEPILMAGQESPYDVQGAKAYLEEVFDGGDYDEFYLMAVAQGTPMQQVAQKYIDGEINTSEFLDEADEAFIYSLAERLISREGQEIVYDYVGRAYGTWLPSLSDFVDGDHLQIIDEPSIQAFRQKSKEVDFERFSEAEKQLQKLEKAPGFRRKFGMASPIEGSLEGLVDESEWRNSLEVMAHGLDTLQTDFLLPATLVSNGRGDIIGFKVNSVASSWLSQNARALTDGDQAHFEPKNLRQTWLFAKSGGDVSAAEIRGVNYIRDLDGVYSLSFGRKTWAEQNNPTFLDYLDEQIELQQVDTIDLEQYLDRGEDAKLFHDGYIVVGKDTYGSPKAHSAFIGERSIPVEGTTSGELVDFESASPTLQADPNKNQRGYFRKPVSVAISPSRAKRKKLRAVFTYDDGSKSTTNFGGIKENGEPYEDFTIHKDPERKKRYIKRHKKNEDWTANKARNLEPICPLGR